MQLQEQEKKKAYAAELQAQMQERQAQRQEDRFHRLGAPAAGAVHAEAHMHALRQHTRTPRWELSASCPCMLLPLHASAVAAPKRLAYQCALRLFRLAPCTLPLMQTLLCPVPCLHPIVCLQVRKGPSQIQHLSRMRPAAAWAKTVHLHPGSTSSSSNTPLQGSTNSPIGSSQTLRWVQPLRLWQALVATPAATPLLGCNTHCSTTTSSCLQAMV